MKRYPCLTQMQNDTKQKMKKEKKTKTKTFMNQIVDT